MNRAETKALEAYPVNMERDIAMLPGDEYVYYDNNTLSRSGFIQGYHQAEKDLELTWEDLEKIESLIKKVRNEFWGADRKHSQQVKEGMYKEALRRFNEERE